jgi:tetratricopeptide (TPR) repeat protein
MNCSSSLSNRWQYERGNFKTAKLGADLARSLIEKQDKSFLPNRNHFLSLIHDILGCIANGSNNPGASMEHNRIFLDLRMEIASSNGKNDELLAYAHNQLGCAWMMAKMYKQGAELFALALKIWHSLPSYHPGDASMEYANLGLALLLQGRVEEASKLLEEGHQARVEGYGENDTESFR